MAEVLQILNNICNSEIKKEQMEEYQAILSSNQNRTHLINFILSPDLDRKYRILAFSAIKKFKIQISEAEIVQFYPLLYDTNYQKYIAELIAIRTENLGIIQNILTDIKNKILQEGPKQIFLNAFIELAYYLVRERHFFSSELFSFMANIAINHFNSIDHLYQKDLIETIIRQLLNYDYYDHEKSQQHTKGIISNIQSMIQLLSMFEINETNFIFFDYILKYIYDKILFINEFKNCFDQRLLVCLNKIIEFALTKCPLDPTDYLIPTVLNTLFLILESIDTDMIIDISKLFWFLTYGEKQLFMIQNNHDYFFSVFFDCQDDYSDENQGKNDENDANDAFWEYLNYSHTLNDLQCTIQSYISDKYGDSANAFFISHLNESPQRNITIFSYFIRQTSEVFIDIKNLAKCDDYVYNFLLFDFCLSQIEYIIDESKIEENLYYIFLKQNFNKFANVMFISNKHICDFAMLRIVMDAPIEFIDSSIFITTLLKSLQAYFSLSSCDCKYELLEKIFEYLILKKAASNCVDFVHCENPDARKFLSKSIFCLNDQFIEALIQNSNILFNLLLSIFKDCVYNSEMTRKLLEIVQLFIGTDICHFISRNRGQNESVVDMQKYSLFWPKIIYFFVPFLDELTKNQDLIDACFQLFICIFSTIQIANNSDLNSIFIRMHHIFTQYDFTIIRQITNIELVPRIFIKYGLLKDIDNMCYLLCQDEKHLYLINNLTFEFSFILINPNNIYPDKSIFQIKDFLLKVLSAKKIEFIQQITLIFARVALSDKNRIVSLLGNDLFDILQTWFDISLKKSRRFLLYFELEKRLMIAFFILFSEKQQIALKAKELLKYLLFFLDNEFSTQMYNFSIKSTLGLIKEDNFYEDQMFLTNPLISMSVKQLIQYMHPEQEFSNFISKYPNL